MRDHHLRNNSNTKIRIDLISIANNRQYQVSNSRIKDMYLLIVLVVPLHHLSIFSSPGHHHHSYRLREWA